MNRRPQLQILAPNATPEEAAAVVAALEQFMRNHAPVRVDAKPQLSPWKAAALREASTARGGWVRPPRPSGPDLTPPRRIGPQKP